MSREGERGAICTEGEMHAIGGGGSGAAVGERHGKQRAGEGGHGRKLCCG